MCSSSDTVLKLQHKPFNYYFKSRTLICFCDARKNHKSPITNLSFHPCRTTIHADIFSQLFYFVATWMKYKEKYFYAWNIIISSSVIIIPNCAWSNNDKILFNLYRTCYLHGSWTACHELLMRSKFFRSFYATTQRRTYLSLIHFNFETFGLAK